MVYVENVKVKLHPKSPNSNMAYATYAKIIRALNSPSDIVHSGMPFQNHSGCKLPSVMVQERFRNGFPECTISAHIMQYSFISTTYGTECKKNPWAVTWHISQTF